MVDDDNSSAQIFKSNKKVKRSNLSTFLVVRGSLPAIISHCKLTATDVITQRGQRPFYVMQHLWRSMLASVLNQALTCLASIETDQEKMARHLLMKQILLYRVSVIYCCFALTHLRHILTKSTERKRNNEGKVTSHTLNGHSKKLFGHKHSTSDMHI